MMYGLVLLTEGSIYSHAIKEGISLKPTKLSYNK